MCNNCATQGERCGRPANAFRHMCLVQEDIGEEMRLLLTFVRRVRAVANLMQEVLYVGGKRDHETHGSFFFRPPRGVEEAANSQQSCPLSQMPRGETMSRDEICVEAARV